MTILFKRPDGKLWIGSLKGGTPRELWWQPPTHSPEWWQFSADGSKLAVVDGADLWIVAYPEGRVRKIFSVSESGAMLVSWFPDSRHLVASDNTGIQLSRLYMLDTRDGSWRTIYSEAREFAYVAVSPDGKRIAYDMFTFDSEVLEVSLLDGKVRTVLGEGGASLDPDWNPSGTHYLVATDRSGDHQNIDDISLDGFSRRVADAPEGASAAVHPKWAPDGARFAFMAGGKVCTLMLANASGGREIAIAKLGVLRNSCPGFSWSPDGQWIVGSTAVTGKRQLVKIKPVAGSTPVIIPSAEPDLITPQWSPAGDWILYSSTAGMSLVSPDGAKNRKLSPRQFAAYGFSKDGREAFGIEYNRGGGGPQWRLYSVNVNSGGEKMLASLDVPLTTRTFEGFSLHPDGKRFLTSINKQNWDIWTLEGFDRPNSWLDLLLRR